VAKHNTPGLREVKLRVGHDWKETSRILQSQVPQIGTSGGNLWVTCHHIKVCICAAKASTASKFDREG